MAAALAVFVFRFFAGKERDGKIVFAILCFSVYYGVLIFGTIVSKVMTANIFVDRYLFFAVGLLWLFAAIMLSDDKRIFCVALIAAVAIGAGTYVIQFKAEYGNSADEEIEFLRENIAEGDVLFCIGGHEELENCIPFYTYLDVDTAELTFIYPLDNAIKTADERGVTLWIAVLDGYSPSEEELTLLRENGLTLQKEADFEFDRYRCEFDRAAR
jgi:hypothetical protein